MTPALEISNISKSFGKSSTPAVKNATLQLQPGRVLGLLGESGCGKTTLLRIIAGFERPESGNVKVNSRTVVSEDVFVAPGKRNIGMIFQDFALFPHLTVVENILFGVTEKDRSKRAEIANKMLNLANLQGLEKRKPGQLSGGQQQRLALARCLAVSPSLLLLDEPFSNLDVTLRQQVREQVSHLLKTTHTAAVLVTHDINDAISLCHEIAVMRAGEVMQVGTFDEIYFNPKNEYIARLTGEVVDLTGILKQRFPEEYAHVKSILLRPENMRVRGSRPQMRARVLEKRFGGRNFEYLMQCDDYEFTLPLPDALEPGSEINLFFSDDELFRFS